MDLKNEMDKIEKDKLVELKNLGYISDTNVVNTEKLMGSKLKTGNGVDKKDSYTIENNKETQKYALVYYNKEGEKKVLGDLFTSEILEETAESYFDITSDGLVSLKEQHQYYAEPYEESFDNNAIDITVLVIPKTVNGIQVKTIGTMKNSKITKIVIPEGTIGIEYEAFYSCRSLETLIIPNTVTTIEGAAFKGSGLQHISIPDSVVNCDSSIFDEARKLESIHLGKGITTDFYYGDLSLKQITVSEENTVYKSENNILFSKDGKKLIKYPIGRNDTRFVVPDTVEIIGVDAFSVARNLEEIVLSPNVVTIEGGAFSQCSSMKKIELSSTLKEIGEWAFNRCSNIQSITIPKSVEVVKERAFYDWNNKQKIIIPYTEGTIPSTWDSNWKYMCKAQISYEP